MGGGCIDCAGLGRAAHAVDWYETRDVGSVLWVLFLTRENATARLMLDIVWHDKRGLLTKLLFHAARSENAVPRPRHFNGVVFASRLALHPWQITAATPPEEHAYDYGASRTPRSHHV